MGRLSNLNKLTLTGLKHLRDPPRNIQKDVRDCICYLNSKLHSGQKFYSMKLMLLGNSNRGKTTLVARLKGLQVGQKSTDGLDISEWSYSGGFTRKKYHFNIWDFGGREEYYAMHQCFLSRRSMYLLLWNVKHGREGIRELKPWLDNLCLRAPWSCVLIVGTHLDEVENVERPMVDNLLMEVGELAETYSSKLHILEILAVGLMNRLENIEALREAIYNQATSYKEKGSLPVMGQEIPVSYFQLFKELEKIQEDVHNEKREPVMHCDEFKHLVQQLKLPDICTDDELRTASIFLNEIGTILHFDDGSHSLNELLFIDPRWLYDMISKVVTVHERNSFVKNGILHSQDIPQLFRDSRMLWKYFEQYVTLLDRFEVALPLDNRRILIPSMLPEERPADANLPDDSGSPNYRRYITFGSETPLGFWSRLVSRVMYMVPQVCKVLDYESLSVENDTSSITVTDESSSVQISVSSPVSPTTDKSPFLLPNITRFIVEDDYLEPFNPKEVKLIYWKEGIVYKSPDLCFCVESLYKSGIKSRTSCNGILVMASSSVKGMKTICLLVDMITAFIHEWYPGIEKHSVQQKVPCYECMKMKHSLPFEFCIDQYMSIITSNQWRIQCGYDSKNPSNNHSVSLDNITPDLLLYDLDKDFILKSEEIKYKNDNDSFIGEGCFGDIYRGKYQGKNVAIKKYDFNELRSQAKMLQTSHHPCVIGLVGVSVHPLMALVLEEAPMGTLDMHLITKPIPIARVAIFRIAAQVAAAVRFLHQHGNIFRDLKASNVMLWSLDERSLCHCKVANFDIATQMSPLGAIGTQGTKGFVAPEVLFIGRLRSVYNHKADIFSFGMLLYQMIARRYPFHNVPVYKIEHKLVQGERPSVIDIPVADTGFYYLTRLMKYCWEDKPEKRPETDELIARLSNVIVQSVMSVQPLHSHFSLRLGCAIIPRNYTKANVNNEQSSELWICCDSSEGTELNIYDTNQMIKINKNFMEENQVQCMCVCGDHVWVCSRTGVKCGVIDVFNILSGELVHNIRMRENTICCITTANDYVYVGTLEGYVFAFPHDLKALQANEPPRHQFISENAIEGITATRKHVWVSHTRFMFFLNLETLKMEHQLTCSSHKEDFIGSLYLSEETNIVWSAHLGGSVISAWNAEEETHMYDINASQALLDVETGCNYDAIMTCMTPALDTVWVGMATGHILVFHNADLLHYVRPYKEYIRFLVHIPCEGPTHKEKCMVVSGAKCFQSLVQEFPTQLPASEDEKGQPIPQSGVMILWEAFSGDTLRQIKDLESETPGYLENHTTVARMVRLLNFKDETRILDDRPLSKDKSKSTILNTIDDHFLNSISDDELPRSMLTQSLAGQTSPLSNQPNLMEGTLHNVSPEPMLHNLDTEGLSFSLEVDAQQLEEIEVVKPT